MIAAEGLQNKGHSDGTRLWMSNGYAAGALQKYSSRPNLHLEAACPLLDGRPMVALREEWSDERLTEQAPAPEAEGARWMSLRHASCRLNVCPATLRRRMRKGELPSRVVNHGRRWAYEVLVPEGASPCAGPTASISMEAYLRRQAEEKERETARLAYEVERQQQQIENLSQALARALAGRSYSADDSPFARYRQLVVPRRRWWFF